MTPSAGARAAALALVHPDVANVRQYRGSATVNHVRVHAAMRAVGDRLQAELDARIAARRPRAMGHQYGPHRPEDAPATVTVLELVKWPRPRECPLPLPLVRQREQLNNIAHRKAHA